jgi:lactoylglutathione lyase
MAAAGRPFRVLGLQQVAVGGLDKRALSEFWADLLGLERKGSFRDVAQNVDEDILSLGAGPLAVELDLMQPIDPASRPRVHEPALNHVGLWVDDLSAAVAWLGARGVRFTPGGIVRGAAGHQVCFIHPKGDASAPRGALGVLVELVQAPPEVVAAFDAERRRGP